MSAVYPIFRPWTSAGIQNSVLGSFALSEVNKAPTNEVKKYQPANWKPAYASQ